MIPPVNSVGFNLLDVRKFQTDLNAQIDVLEFKEELKPTFIPIIEYLKKIKANLSKVFTLTVYENNILLPDSQYTVDFSTYTITTLNPDSNKTYSLAIYGDVKLLNLLDKYIRENRETRIAKLDIF